MNDISYKHVPAHDRVVPNHCTFNTTPACLEALYSIPTTPAVSRVNLLGVTGFENNFASEADLEVRVRVITQVRMIFMAKKISNF